MHVFDSNRQTLYRTRTGCRLLGAELARPGTFCYSPTTAGNRRLYVLPRIKPSSHPPASYSGRVALLPTRRPGVALDAPARRGTGGSSRIAWNALRPRLRLTRGL